jgi:hypothetical protein
LPWESTALREGLFRLRLHYDQNWLLIWFKLSKPGAAPIAVFLSHEIIGLFDGGYEYLLGAAMLTSVKVSDLRRRHRIEHLIPFSLFYVRCIVTGLRCLSSLRH